jgi:hypothetical protein
VKPFRDIQVDDLIPHAMQDEIDSRGYVPIRGPLPQGETADSLLGEITQIRYAAGGLLSDHDPRERMADRNAACGDREPSFKGIYREVFNLESCHALVHHPALKQAMRVLIGDQLLVHPKPIGRLIFPDCERLVVGRAALTRE